MRIATVAVLCLALTACGDGAGDDAAQAACHAYARNPATAAQRSDLRTTATREAQRAAEADDAYGALPHDMDDAWSRMDAMAATHNAGGQVSAGDLDAYFASDRRVRADCADAGAALGPLKP